MQLIHDLDTHLHIKVLLMSAAWLCIELKLNSKSEALDLQQLTPTIRL